ncbi:TlpA family protein disulfide reductase [Carboxylicivirga linearis]|uniref:Redoxin family protein n=1 Tax=Carboxylicivirga linearis TaxID=1628157 RepID=A0ABS5JU18_9BACT|nr:redoxin family protein [Carboxylicivirga linearis]MBS2098370.1 redoxin family protein [Carboxylicivirga linearis]
MEKKRGFWAEQWHKYRRKKTIWGIAFDFIFTALLISMLFPASRKIVSATIIRYSMFQPRETEDLIYLKENDYNWYLVDMNGNRHQFSEFKGQAVFLNLWATWCPPCIAEMPSIQRLYSEYGDKMAFVLASQEEANIIQAFVESKGYTFPIYNLAGGMPDVLSSRSIPASFLISPEGKVIMKKQGAAKWDGKKVKQILDEMIQ